jgi:hypothetical protein
MFDLLWTICGYIGAFSLVFSVGFVGLALLNSMTDRRRSDASDAREEDFHA